MAKRIEDFEIKSNIRLNNDLFILELAGNNKLPLLKPGQFAQVKVEGSQDTFLRRPISIHDVDYEKNAIRLLIQIAGKGTEKLSGLKYGDFVNIIYPLGNSFGLPRRDEKVLLVGGGCGVAPLLFLAKHLKSNGLSPEILLGFRNSDRVVEYDDFASLGPVYLTTDDGSVGRKGIVTDHPVLNEIKFDKIFCCGPELMMKAVAGYCLKNEIDCEVSLENLMACGFGVCLCCVVNTVRGNLCSCTDGPVFNTKDLKW